MHLPETARWRRRSGKAASFPKQHLSGRRRALGAAVMGHAAISCSAAVKTQCRPSTAKFTSSKVCRSFSMPGNGLIVPFATERGMPVSRPVGRRNAVLLARRGGRTRRGRDASFRERCAEGTAVPRGKEASSDPSSWKPPHPAAMASARPRHRSGQGAHPARRRSPRSRPVRSG